MAKLILFNKPYGVISQFSAHPAYQCLSDYIDDESVYPAGRLDQNSEGLMLLTNSGQLQNAITSPKNKTEKVYWVQVEGEPNKDAMISLKAGVMIKTGLTLPAKVKAITPPHVWPRIPPIRQRKKLKTSWLEIKIIEGKNRQIRQMTAAVHHPTLRLIRVKIGPWSLKGLKPGEQLNTVVHLPQTKKRQH